MTGAYTLYKGLSDLHNESAKGILSRDARPVARNWQFMPAVAGEGGGFSRIQEKAGLGMPIGTHQLKE